jgi:hypothetical protein
MRTGWLWLLMIPSWGAAQIDHSKVVGTAGETFTTPTHIVSYTIGEPVVETGVDTTSGKAATQGFHQGYYRVITGTIHQELLGKISVFPNPTDRFLNISLSGSTNSASVVALLSSEGKLLYSNTLIQHEVLDLNLFQGQIFILRIYNQAGTDLATYKIIKI